MAPRTNASSRPPAGTRSRTPVRPASVPTNLPRSIAMSLDSAGYLLNEAMSRARMRWPQDNHTEAFRPARQIMMRARREQTRQLGR